MYPCTWFGESGLVGLRHRTENQKDPRYSIMCLVGLWNPTSFRDSQLASSEISSKNAVINIRFVMLPHQQCPWVRCKEAKVAENNIVPYLPLTALMPQNL